MNKVISRLFKYQRVIKNLDKQGNPRVFSSHLAQEVGVSPSQVRKDFSKLAITGQKRGGYQTAYLINRINALINPTSKQETLIIGMGKIGQALTNYHGFKDEHIDILAGFDLHENLDYKIPIYHIARLTTFVKDHGIKVVILAVPDNVAKETGRLLEEIGILGILNFTGSDLLLSDRVFVKNLNLKLTLKNIFYHVQHDATPQPETTKPEAVTLNYTKPNKIQPAFPSGSPEPLK